MATPVLLSLPEAEPLARARRHSQYYLSTGSHELSSVVQQMLGHKSATMTFDLYGHLFGGRLDVVADAMNAARDAALSARVAHPLPTAPVIELAAVRELSTTQQIPGIQRVGSS